MGDEKNFLVAIALSVFVFVTWQYFFGLPAVEEQQARQEVAQTETAEGTAPTLPTSPQTGPSAPPERQVGPTAALPGMATEPSRDSVIATAPRIVIESPRLDGSISLTGLRFDDLKLKDYREAIEPDSKEIVLLSPSPAPGAYYVDFGWLADQSSGVALPDESTEWQASRSGPLTPTAPAEFFWDNGQGQTFVTLVELDDDYVFTVTQSVQNNGSQTLTLHPYANIVRHDTPEVSGFFILHEGMLGVFGDTLEEVDYDDLVEDGAVKTKSTGGWMGITDKYWLTALLPDQSQAFESTFSANRTEENRFYQAYYVLTTPFALAPGAKVKTTNRLFAGAKKKAIIDKYVEKLGIARFDLAIDWGWLFFLTKPFFSILHWVGDIVGNFGIAILIVTVLIKIVFFPLANKSYVAMSKMKKLQPEMTKIRERFTEDKVRQQQEMMELYKREKVNPMAGCLPIVIQIPVFFALYKVLFVTIEMRHAPFYGWIKDLSAADPTSMFNLFGLIPWDPPAVLMVGIWPLIMGLTMFIQQKMNPAPADPVQEKIFLFMPLFFTYLLASFPAGLVIYWAWNNALSVLQQYVIMRRMGVEVDIGQRLIPEKMKALFRKPGGSTVDDASDKK